MKTSNTKRALAFWLAVAMLATGVPAAFAAEPVPTSSEMMTLTLAEPVQPTTQALTIDSATVPEKTYDGTADVKGEIVVTFRGVSKQPTMNTDYTVTGVYEDANAGQNKKVTVTVTLTEEGKQQYTLEENTVKTTTSIAAAAPRINVPKQTVQVGTTLEELARQLSLNVKATGVASEEVAGTFSDLTVSEREDFAKLSAQEFTQDKGVYTLTGKFTPASANYTAVDNVRITCDVTGKTEQQAAFKTTEAQTYEKNKTVDNAVEVTTGNTSGTITYDSSDESVATISEEGLITILKAGTTTISATIPGNDTYEAKTISYQLTVTPKNISGATITDIPAQPYTGDALEPDFTVNDGETTLVKGTDYDLTYANNKFPGTATVTVTFKGNYAGTATKNFTINAASYTNTAISQSVIAGQDAVLTIPTDLANAEITNYSAITVGGASIVKGAPTRNQNVITAKIKPDATNGQQATVQITLTTRGYDQVTLTYTLTVTNSKTQLTSSQINFASKTVTANGSYFKLENASLNGVNDTAGKWTYALKGVNTLNDTHGDMPAFKDPGTYTIVASYEGENYIGSKEATLTINPAVKSTIKIDSVSQVSKSEDDNYSYFDVRLRDAKDGYVRVYAEADDYLDTQKINGTTSEWIGMTIKPLVNGSATTNLWASTNKKDWYKLSSKPEFGDFYIKSVGNNTFDLWYDTDDRDCSDSLYLATDANGANLFVLYVDFDSYSGSSSSSGGSSSSSTSKVDGDYVATTTVDKTPSVKSGSATISFSTSTLSDALDDNKKEAKRKDADKTYIELDVRTSKSVDDTTVTVPRSSLDKIADEDTGLILTTNHGTFTFDDRALAKIYDACDRTSIEFYIEEDDDEYTLLIKDGSDELIDLGSGEVAVTFEYRLKSGEKSSDVSVYRTGDGDKKFDYAVDMKASYSSTKKEATFTTDTLGTFLVTTDTLKTGPETPVYTSFRDVPSTRWSAPYINKLASLGIINGTGGGYFEPTLYVTREEFVKMLAGVAGANVNSYSYAAFPDVPASRWSAPYIAWAANRGITTGTDGGRFAPTMKITREEMATMIYRYVQAAGKTLPAKNAPVVFADANLIDGWAKTPVSIMQQAGIIDGNVTNGRYTFDPKVPASREECAKMLAILYDLL